MRLDQDFLFRSFELIEVFFSTLQRHRYTQDSQRVCGSGSRGLRWKPDQRVCVMLSYIATYFNFHDGFYVAFRSYIHDLAVFSAFSPTPWRWMHGRWFWVTRRSYPPRSSCCHSMKLCAALLLSAAKFSLRPSPESISECLLLLLFLFCCCRPLTGQRLVQCVAHAGHGWSRAWRHFNEKHGALVCPIRTPNTHTHTLFRHSRVSACQNVPCC